MVFNEWFQIFPACLLNTGASSYHGGRVGRKLRLFLWTAILFTESATIYSVFLLAHLHRWV